MILHSVFGPPPWRWALLSGVLLLLGATAASAAPFVYVVNHGDDTVSVLDTATNAVVATVNVGNQPLGAAVAPGGMRAYVANQVTPSGTVSVIDTSMNEVTATVSVGSGPSGVAVKLPGDRVYVTNRDSKTVSVIDTAANVVVATVTVGNNPLGIAIDPAGTPAYVVNKGSNNVSLIDTVTNTVIGTVPVGNDPSQVAVAPNGKYVYVSNASNASVSVIDTGVRAVVATVSVGSIPEGVAVDPSGTRLYVANSGPNSVSVIDTAMQAVVGTVNVGLTPFEVGIRPDGARAFAINRQSANVSVIDTTTSTVVATVPVGSGPTGMGEPIEPGLRVPLFGFGARKCQMALLRQAVRLVKVHHGLEVACRLGIRRAQAAGKTTVPAEAACLGALDLSHPGSKLSRAHTKLRAALERKCRDIAPVLMNGPCDRGAASVSATVDCLLPQHAGLAVGLADDELAPVYPMPLSRPALACQTAIAKQGRRFADRLHKDFAGCLEKLFVAAATGKGEADAVARCFMGLDSGNPLSKVAVARTMAFARIAKKCVGVSPAEIGSPCDGGAATVAATVLCVMDAHASDIAKLMAAEANDVCMIMTRLGLARRYPAACSGP